MKAVEEGFLLGFCMPPMLIVNTAVLVELAVRIRLTLTRFPAATMQTGDPVSGCPGAVTVHVRLPVARTYWAGKYMYTMSLLVNR